MSSCGSPSEWFSRCPAARPPDARERQPVPGSSPDPSLNQGVWRAQEKELIEGALRQARTSKVFSYDLLRLHYVTLDSAMRLHLLCILPLRQFRFTRKEDCPGPPRAVRVSIFEALFSWGRRPSRARTNP